MEWVQPAKWWQLMVVAFGGILTANGTPIPFAAKSLLVVPPGTRCTLERLTSADTSQCWIKFSPRTEGDYRIAIPQVTALDATYEFFEQELRRGIDWIPLSRARINATLSHLLWFASQDTTSLPEDPTLSEIEKRIQAKICEDIDLNQLAEEANMSLTKMTSLFHDQHD